MKKLIVLIMFIILVNCVSATRTYLNYKTVSSASDITPFAGYSIAGLYDGNDNNAAGVALFTTGIYNDKYVRYFLGDTYNLTGFYYFNTGDWSSQSKSYSIEIRCNFNKSQVLLREYIPDLGAPNMHNGSQTINNASYLCSEFTFVILNCTSFTDQAMGASEWNVTAYYEVFGTPYSMASVNWEGYVPLNNTIWNNNSLTFTFNVTTENVLNMNCSLNKNNSLYEFKSNLSTTGTNTFMYNISPTEDANYNFNITCYDADNASRTATSSNKYIVIDKIVPSVTVTNPTNSTQQSYTSNLILTGYCSDTNLYEAEINITNSTGATKYYHYNSSLPTNYVFTNTTDSSSWSIGQYSGVIRCGDDHNLISDGTLTPVFEKIDESSLVFDNKYATINLVAKSDDVIIDKSTQTLTKDGGYKIAYDLSKVSATKDNDIAFDVTCDGKLTLLDATKAHFLCGNKFSRLSIDFEDELKSGAKLNIEKIRDDYYIVHVITSKLIIDPYVGSVNTGYSFFNFSLFNFPPQQPTLNYPTHLSLGVPLSPNLNVSVNDTDGDAMTVKFVLTNGSVICTNTGVAAGTATNCSFNNLEEEKTYTWYANASDGTNNVNSSIWQFTTVRFHYGVNLTVSAPTNNTEYSSSTQTVAFVFSGVDGISPFDCSLQINDTINTTSSFNNNTNSLFLVSFNDDGIYDWKINCSDGVYYNESNVYTMALGMTIPVPPTVITVTVDSGTGGGGGGGGTNIVTRQSYDCVLNLGTTYVKVSESGSDIIEFCNNNQKNLTYSFEFSDSIKPYCNIDSGSTSLNPGECFNLGYTCNLLSDEKIIGSLNVITNKYEDDYTIVEPCNSSIDFYLGKLTLWEQYKIYMGKLYLIVPVGIITLVLILMLLLYLLQR